MIEIGAPTVLALGPGIISIATVFVIFAIAVMYAIGRHDGRRAQDRDTARRILPQISRAGIEELKREDPSPELLKLLEREISRRKDLKS